MDHYQATFFINQIKHHFALDKMCYNLRNSKNLSSVEAGSNTSTVTLQVVGGDEKGSLKSETVKYGREFQGTPTRERLRWQGASSI
jgi:hypothetical protein